MASVRGQWRIRLLWAVWMVQACVSAMAARGGVGEENIEVEVEEYWGAKLQGGSMPATIRAMLSPLTPLQTTHLLLHISANPGYLPTHSASFCKAAHISCGSDFHVGPERSRRSAQSGVSRDLMSTTVQETAGLFFRRDQVLVTDATIHINDPTYHNSMEKDDRAFLPRKLAEIFPLSGNGMDTISSMLDIPFEALQDTIDACSVKTNGEVHECLTSVEDVADFVSSVIPSTKPINAYDSIPHSSNTNFSGNTYKVHSVRALKQHLDEPSVTCHEMAFPFQVFSCHSLKKTMFFDVTLKGEDGSSHKRLAACHYDTSFWNHKHFVCLAELKYTKSTEGEICHWFPNSQRSWVFSRV